ncbi:hypothetical protein BD413DRAFT_463336 [Trametes elegans]|nr:hypothetical protein BD413DRAFT_463336 [Trametes elegans]
MFARLPQTSHGMRNPFIVLRFVMFAILFYVNLLTVGFSVWNISVLKGLGGLAVDAPTFVVFNACLLLALLAACLVLSWYTSTAFDQVRYECGWTGIMSALQLASSIDITINGPPALCQGVSITACASSSLVVALSWVSSTMLLMYSFSLMTTAITHLSVIPDVWGASVCAVPWFAAPSGSVESRISLPEVGDTKPKEVSGHFRTPIFEQYAKALPKTPARHEPPSTPPIWQARRSSLSIIDDPSSKRTTWTNRIFSGVPSISYKRSTESLRPSWAKRGGSTRRGVDHPFAVPRAAPRPPQPPTVRPLRTFKLKSCWSPSTASPQSHVAFSPRAPARPPKARVAGTTGTGAGAGAGAPHSERTVLSPTSTFYIDLERDAVVPVGGAHYGRPQSYGMFPEDVVDPDMPVTRSQRSEWVRADSPSSSTRSRSR